jgi:hypothetical protein
MPLLPSLQLNRPRDGFSMYGKRAQYVKAEVERLTQARKLLRYSIAQTEMKKIIIDKVIEGAAGMSVHMSVSVRARCILTTFLGSAGPVCNCSTYVHSDWTLTSRTLWVDCRQIFTLYMAIGRSKNIVRRQVLGCSFDRPKKRVWHKHNLQRPCARDLQQLRHC